MGRAPCCDKANVKRGPWSAEEDTILKNYLEQFGNGGNWIALPRKSGLKRCGKSCRLRWLNYLRPDIKHGGFTEEEDNIICSLYCSIGSRWSVIASQMPGRTDNDVKNYWNTKLKKKILAGKVSNNKSNQVSVTIPEFGTSAYANSSANSYPVHQRMISDPSLTFPGLMDVSDYRTSANSSDGTMSSSQVPASSLPVSSSTLENNYVLRSTNGNVEDEGSLLDFSIEYLHEFLNGFDF